MRKTILPEIRKGKAVAPKRAPKRVDVPSPVSVLSRPVTKHGTLETVHVPSPVNDATGSVSPLPAPVAKSRRPKTPEETDTTARPTYRDPVVAPELQGPTSHACAHCRKKVPLRKCQVHRCAHVLPENIPWKICSECLFERGGLSFEEFGERHRQEALCPFCSKTWASKSKSA